MRYFRGNTLRAPTLHKSGEYQASRAMPWDFMYRDVAQLVARTAGGGEVAGSSPVIPTKIKNTLQGIFLFWIEIVDSSQRLF